MKPMKNLVPLAKWFLRVAIAVIAYQSYLDKALTFSFNGVIYFIALAFVICSVAIIIGGFIKDEKTTVISGLVIVLLCIIIVFNGGFNFDTLLEQFVPASLGFYFMARGNWG